MIFLQVKHLLLIVLPTPIRLANRRSGTTMNVDDFLPHICEAGAEDLRKYFIGGYHPVHIGERFENDRYEVVHKLGFGENSTVWLTVDHTDNRLVALKILAAAAFNKTWEMRVLEVLANGDPYHPGRRVIPKLLNKFDIEGPNGRHHCLVLEVAGCTVPHSKMVQYPWQFPLAVAKAIVSELIMGLDYIHECGVVHGGKYEACPLGGTAANGR